METGKVFFDLFTNISWLWYAIAVLTAYATGALWYTVLFGKQWIKAVHFECQCGAKLYKGEKCSCGPRFPWEMAFQFVSTAFIGLMYFVLTPVSIWMAVLICLSFSAWTKSMYKFEISSWKRFTTLAAINVGYFVVVSAIFMAMSHL